VNEFTQSWVGTGPNQDIAPQYLADAPGSDTLDALSQHTGMARGGFARQREPAFA
jgi:uncharacterized protein YidB (DUF937 family)